MIERPCYARNSCKYMAIIDMDYEDMLHNGGSPGHLLPAIAAFARVAHHGSFTRAAAELGVSPSALSQTVRGLEKQLGVRVLERSTRRVPSRSC
jgi:molybdenum-dependent DNA-binding transcriptional regulator ModE